MCCIRKPFNQFAIDGHWSNQFKIENVWMCAFVPKSMVNGVCRESTLCTNHFSKEVLFVWYYYAFALTRNVRGEASPVWRCPLARVPRYRNRIPFLEKKKKTIRLKWRKKCRNFRFCRLKIGRKQTKSLEFNLKLVFVGIVCDCDIAPFPSVGKKYIFSEPAISARRMSHFVRKFGSSEAKLANVCYCVLAQYATPTHAIVNIAWKMTEHACDFDKKEKKICLQNVHILVQFCQRFVSTANNNNNNQRTVHISAHPIEHNGIETIGNPPYMSHNNVMTHRC